MLNEHGSQVKDQVRRQCRHSKHKKFPYRPTGDVSLLSAHAFYLNYDLDMRIISLSLSPSHTQTHTLKHTIKDFSGFNKYHGDQIRSKPSSLIKQHAFLKIYANIDK